MVIKASIILGLGLVLAILSSIEATALQKGHNYAYATMMYMGTPRDYEFYVAIRVMLRSLSKLRVDADLVVIASNDVPLRWIQALEEEDGARVVKVKNLHNPYRHQKRFKLTLNKLYAWSLVDYQRVVMLDADNLFLKNTDELFQCGQFCAVFINPCIFHTGLFVLEPSMDVFNDMVHELKIEKSNPDGADQGFIGGYFPDLLDKPMFHPPALSGAKLNGTYRLPLGYQMDASYYYLRLRWNVPCGPNSVITFPSAPWLKPWYWWSWPVLPLGLDWHQTRSLTVGYGSEMTFVVIQVVVYFGIIVITRMTSPNISKFCYRQSEKNLNSIVQMGLLKFMAIWSILAAYIIPFLVIPYTVHPLMGWALYLLGVFALCSIIVNVLLLPMLHVLMPWLGILGALFVLAYPWYGNGVLRALFVFAYGVCCAPIVWISLVKLVSCLNFSLVREAYFSRINEYIPSSSGFNKLF